MEIKIKVPDIPKISKKVMVLILTVIIALAASIYLYFFLGKPFDVSHEIWFKGKSLYQAETGSKQFSTIDDRAAWYLDMKKFLQNNRLSNPNKHYSADEMKIIDNMNVALNNWGYCSDDEIALDEIKCYDYKNSLNKLAGYFD